MSLGDDHFVSFATDVSSVYILHYGLYLVRMLMMLQVAEALKFIGEERFVHRDIAARNCLGIRKGDGGGVRTTTPFYEQGWLIKMILLS